MNAGTNRMNAHTNRMNAVSNRISANASMFNARTGRMEAYTRSAAVAQQIVESTERVTGIKLDNKQKGKLIPFIVGSAKEDYNTKRNSNYWENQIYNDRISNKFSSFGWGLYDSGRKFMSDYSPFKFR